MSKIYGFGSVALDFRVVTAELGREYTSKLLAKETFVMPGGAVANSLIQSARLGGESVYLGKLGSDSIGKRIVENLRKENVAVEKIVYTDENFSPFNVAVYAGDKRRRIGGYLLENSLNDVTAEEIETFAVDIQRGDILLVEIGEISVEKCLLMCKMAKAKGAKVIVDVDLDPVVQCGATMQTVENLFSLADLLIPNIECLKFLLGETEAEGAAKSLSEKYGVTTIITEGDKGCICCKAQGGDVRRYAAYRIDAVDTVGAGDSFHGSLAYALSVGYSLDMAISFATCAAALNCLGFGATTVMPTKKELENIWDFDRKCLK